MQQKRMPHCVRNALALCAKPVGMIQCPVMHVNDRHVLLLFLDGVGLGSADPESNPFVTAHLPHLTRLFGSEWYVNGRGRIQTNRATLVPTDANLDVPHRPQSATGQATILTGRNVPQEVGAHIGPWPTDDIYTILREGTIFNAVSNAGGHAVFLNPYPQRYFDAIARGRRNYSAIPFAAVQAGLPLLTEQDLRNGAAVSPGFTNRGWREQLGVTDMPLLTPHEAGVRMAHLAQAHHFAFVEHWPTDFAGHRGPFTQATATLELIDAVIGGLLAAWDEERGLLIITSDHGNIEEKQHGKHTRNPVPTILLGNNHRESAEIVHNLTDISRVIQYHLGIEP